MNNLKLNLAYPLLLILVTLGFPLKTLSQPIPIHTVYTFKGTIFVSKKQWKKPQSASVGLSLSPDDKLEVKANSSIKVYCSNKTIREVKTGNYNVSSICPSGTGVIKLPNSNNRTLRGNEPTPTEEALAKLPYLITPRESFILTNTPLLRWNKVQGATNYIITIEGINWEGKTNKTEINYTGETPLRQGERYRVIIKADNGTSSKSDSDQVGFKLLDEATQKIVLDAKKTIESQSLTPEEKGIILAHLYRGYELYADAIEVLEDLVKQGSQTVAIYQLLGDTYLRTKLPQLAKKPYEKGLQLAIDTKNLPAQAEIQEGLGITYYNLGEETEAKQWLEKAKASYQELGDSLQVQELEKLIKDNF